MSNKLKEKISELLKKLSKDKKAVIIICIGLLGMLLVAVSGLDSAESVDAREDDNESYSQYLPENKKELESLLSEIEGAGEVRVMITYECGYERVYARDESNQRSENSEKSESEYIIIDNGSAEAGMTVKEIYPKIKGVAVVCQGGNDPTVKNSIILTVKALYDISSNNICVTAMES